MVNHIENYLNARNDYEQAKKDIEQIADDILMVGSALKRDPARFSFSNSGLDLPTEVFSGQSFPAEDWVSSLSIQEKLKKFHEIRLLLRSSWSQIPQNLKSGLQPPPAGVMPPQRYNQRND